MNDNELLEEIEREFGSHSSPAPTESDDLDAFIADLKQAIAPEAPAEQPPKQNTKRAVPPAPPSKREKQSSRPPKKEAPQKPAAEKAPKWEAVPQKEPGKAAGFIIRHHRVVNTILICLCVVLAIGIAAVFLYEGNADPLGSTVMDNVYVAGVDVGGMTREEAYEAVKAAVGTNYTEGVMTVRLGSSTLSLMPSQTRPVLQLDGAVEEAYAYGRTGSTSQRQQDFRDAQFNPKVISLEPYLTLNKDYIRSAVSGLVEGLSGEYAPSGYTLEGEQPALDADNFDSSVPCQTLTLQTGTPGSNFDLDGICNAILEGYYQNQFDVVIPDSLLPEFPEALDIDAIYSQLHVDAVEAVQDSTPGSCGYTFNLEDARAKLEAAGYGETISIPMEYVIPERLEYNGSYTEILSTYSTPLSSIEAYNENLKLLCKELDGLVLQPGENFSFNESFVRTEANGYQKAPRHGDSCADEEIGGGADQVATTLFMAVKYAGLNVTQKSPADHVCEYTTLGTEISVCYNWQDLRFTNTLDIPVKIRAKATSQQVVIRVLSEKPLDFYIKLEVRNDYTNAHGTTFISRKAADGFSTGDVFAEGADGGQVTLQWVKYDKATDTELSRTYESVQIPARHTMIVNVTG